MTKSRTELGRYGERLAKQYLQSKGFIIQDVNVRTRSGEIDIVARDGAYLVFVEVRMRRSQRYGSALESVDEKKRGRLLIAARHYLAQTGNVDTLCRFDVIGIEWNEDRRTPRIEHVVNAI